MQRKIAFAFVLAIGLLGAASAAFAQDRTTGAIKGVITDGANKENVAGATVVATSPALQGTQAEITDDGGGYFISNLPPGMYQITIYYGDAQFTRTNVLVQLGKVAQVNVAINTQATKGETIVIEGRAPVIDQGSTKTGVTIDSDYTTNIPVGRTFGAVLDAASGSQGDFYGQSFGGSTSLENIYVVEGLNTTDPAKGFLSTNLPNEFVQETEVITGGYNAEFGRSTGGVINVVTKSGSNEFSGSVFGYFTPGGLVADEKLTPREGSSITRNDALAYRADVGAEIGGPIVKDKLWFHVGFNPSFTGIDVNRIISQQIDEDGDGVADVDPSTGFTIRREVASRTLDYSANTYFFTGKLSGAVNPDHQGSLSLFGNPGTATDYNSVNGDVDGQKFDTKDGAYDVSGKWTSKFNDNKTQVDVVAGFHRNVLKQNPDSFGSDNPLARYDDTDAAGNPVRTLENFAATEVGIPDGCKDTPAGMGDPYPMIANCPVQNYRTGGFGFRETQQTDRQSGIVAVTQRVKLVGQHTFKGGIDLENQSYDHLSEYTQGTFYRYRRASSGAHFWQQQAFYQVDPNGTEPCGVALDGSNVNCALRMDGLNANTKTRNLGGYVQDSWQILPNLTLDVGVRYEKQQLFTADAAAGQTSAVTGEPIPDVAMEIGNMLAPRIGLIFDPTQEGRSKIFGHYGRFYESIPMDINSRSFGYEIIKVGRTDDTHCTNIADPTTCDISFQRANFPQYSGGDELVAPGTKGQYMDEIVAGGEYELIEDLKVGATFVYRNMPRVIEDLSTDGGATFFLIGNPGEDYSSEVANLRAEAQQLRDAGMTAQADFTDLQADLYNGIKDFDKPSRRYTALEINATQRFSKNLFVQAAYTYSKLKGNFAGLFSPETNQDDPNITSLYDLPELVANRYGELPFDRPHGLKVDGYYQLKAGDIGEFVFGTSLRASSGAPSNYLGSHPVYGAGESYILPRGAGERQPFTSRVDVKLQYGHELSKGTRLDAFVDIFNLFNLQPSTDVDENYTVDDVNPIVGGDTADLKHLKSTVAGNNSTIVTKNPNFGNPTDRQAPLSMRFGVRLTF